MTRPMKLRSWGNCDVLDEDDPGVGSSCSGPLGVERGEVADVGGDDHPALSGSGSEDRLVVMQSHEVRPLRDNGDVVTVGLEGGPDLWRKHCVEKQPGRPHPASRPRVLSAAVRWESSIRAGWSTRASTSSG